jgi:peptidoglycan/xylan/chitin deacetylase (PgdA/CDA1 family)
VVRGLNTRGAEIANRPHPGTRRHRAFLPLTVVLSLSLHCATNKEAPPPSASAEFAWPAGAHCAVSLTYDDGVESQLTVAAPALGRHRLLGTFFPSDWGLTTPSHAERWRELVRAGHELGCHTINHPCDRSHDFVQPGFASEDYTLARMRGELEQNIRTLRGFGYDSDHYVFAYPCGTRWVGEEHESYVPLIASLFIAGRTVEWGAADPLSVSLAEVPSYDAEGLSGDELVGLVQDAAASGGWAVFLFHGVGGDYSAVSAEAH